MKAIGFDLGETLIYYPNVPLSWSSLYRKAIINTAEMCGFPIDESGISAAEEILSKYNTRINPRSEEVTADLIFFEILSAWRLSKDFLSQAEKGFFSFFQRDVRLYDDTLDTLERLKGKGVKLGLLTDVPYGMPDTFVDNDIVAIREYFDVILTSVDAGWRKPDPRGFLMLADRLGVKPEEMAYVGNEPKDVQGAKNAGMLAIRIDRGDGIGFQGEDRMIKSLASIM